MVKIGDKVIQTPTNCGDQGLTEGSMPKVGNKILISKSTDSSNSNKLITHGISSIKLGDNIISKQFYNSLIAVKGGHGPIPLGFWFTNRVLTLQEVIDEDLTFAIANHTVVFDKDFNVIFDDRIMSYEGAEGYLYPDYYYVFDYLHVYELSDGTRIPLGYMTYQDNVYYKLLDESGSLKLTKPKELGTTIGYYSSISFLFNDLIYINTGNAPGGGVNSEWDVYNPETLEVVDHISTMAAIGEYEPEKMYLPFIYQKDNGYLTNNGWEFGVFDLTELKFTPIKITSYRLGRPVSYLYESDVNFCNDSYTIFDWTLDYFGDDGTYYYTIAHIDGSNALYYIQIELNKKIHYDNCYHENFCWIYYHYGSCFANGLTDKQQAINACLKEECPFEGYGLSEDGLHLTTPHTKSEFKDYNIYTESVFVDGYVDKVNAYTELGTNLRSCKVVDDHLFLIVDDNMFIFEHNTFNLKRKIELSSIFPGTIQVPPDVKTGFTKESNGHTMFITDIFKRYGNYYIFITAQYVPENNPNSWNNRKFVFALNASSLATYFNPKWLLELVPHYDDDVSGEWVTIEGMTAADMNLDAN
jgi:hypothetical protein